jgi:hypothetical protein
MVEFDKDKFFRVMVKNSLRTIAASTMYCDLIVLFIVANSQWLQSIRLLYLN